MLKKKKKESKTIVASIEIIVLEYVMEIPRGGGGVHGSYFGGYVKPVLWPIIDPIFVHFLERSEWNGSRLLNIKIR